MFKLNLKQVKELFRVGFYLSMLCGFLIFGMYFIKIGYFPVADLSSLVYFLAIAALATIFFFGCYVSLFGSAPALWIELLRNKDICSVIIRKEDVEKIVSAYKCGRIELEKNPRKRILLAYYIAIIISTASWMLIGSINQYTCLIFFILGVIAVFWTIPVKENSKNDFDYCKNNKKSILLSLIKIYGHSILPGLIILVLFSILIKLLQINNKYLELLIFMAIILNSSFCLTPKSEEWKLSTWIVVTACTSTTAFFILLNLGGNFSTQIIQFLKFGGIRDTSILVNKTGCEIFRINGFDLSCNNNKNVYKVENINILWRVSEYFIQDSKDPTRKMIVPLQYIHPAIFLSNKRAKDN